MRLYLIIEEDTVDLKSANYYINPDIKPKDYPDYFSKREMLINLLGISKNMLNPEIPPTYDPAILESKNIDCFPNPCSSNTEVQFKVESPAFIDIDLIDTFGRKLIPITDEYYQSGTYLIKVSTEDIAKGVYLINMRINDKISGVKKLVIQ